MSGTERQSTSPVAGANDPSMAPTFLRQFFQGTAKQRSRLARKAPVGAIQAAACEHRDPFFRRQCLYFLDHYANDQSMSTFAQALLDPVDFVRNMALHSLTCQSCKSEPLCPATVVPSVVHVLTDDPNPNLRGKAITLLLLLGGPDDEVRATVRRAATEDPDELVRQAAVDALEGRFVVARKRYERRQRRHARFARHAPAR
jgi:HEAT repeats